METEWYHLPERAEVMVNITGVYGGDFASLLAEIEREFTWTGADYFTDTTDGEVEQWMYLLGATRLSTGRESS